MTNSAVVLLFQSSTCGALLVMAHPFRSPQMRNVVAHSVVLIGSLILAAGCSQPKTPAELAAFQGDWQFDEAAYTNLLREQSRDSNTLKGVLRTYRDMKAYGVLPMPNLKIAGSRINSRGEHAHALYDLVDVRGGNSGTTARTVYHDEERGTNVTLDFILQMRGTKLLFSIGEQGFTNTYVFKRPQKG